MSSCSSGVWPLRAEEVAERPDVLLQAAVGRVAAVAAEDLRLGLAGHVAVLVGVAEEEFARLQRAARAGRRLVARALDDRLRHPVAVAEVVVRVVERRGRVEVERREHLRPLATRDEGPMLRLAAIALRAIAGEEDGDGVQVRAGQAAHPVVGVIGARVAEDLGAGDHALLELLGERAQRRLVHSQRPQAVPGEAHGHPAVVLVHRGARLGGRLHRRQEAREPAPPGRGAAEGQELIARRHRRCPGEQDVLDVVEFQHVASSPWTTASGRASWRRPP